MIRTQRKNIKYSANIKGSSENSSLGIKVNIGAGVAVGMGWDPKEV